MFNLNLEKSNKRTASLFIVLFVIMFFAINWGEVSWIFDYNFLVRGAGSYFNKEQPVENKIIINTPVKMVPGKPTEKPDSIEIAKINITAPLILATENTEKYYQDTLKKGVIIYYKSALPGENGLTQILGHSAPLGWPKIYYDWVFNDLNQLEQGDEIIINLSKREYGYSVLKTLYLPKGGEVPRDGLSSEKSYLILLSCWPPGKDINRIAVVAELID